MSVLCPLVGLSFARRLPSREALPVAYVPSMKAGARLRNEFTGLCTCSGDIVAESTHPLAPPDVTHRIGSSQGVSGSVMKHIIGIAAALAAFAGPAALAADPAPAPVLGELGKCRGESDDAKRLACYDRAAGVLAKATTEGSIAVVTREDVKKTRRSLFGFSVPKLPFFSGDKSAEEDTPDEIETTMRSFRTTRDGNLTLVMEDGAVWRTTEPARRMPKPGAKVKIKKAALGSYFIIIDGARGLRGMRVG